MCQQAHKSIKNQVVDLSLKVGNLSGQFNQLEKRLEMVDERVSHNCNRNEDNFKNLDDKIDSLSQQIIGFCEGQAQRVDTLQQQLNNQNKLTQALSLSDSNKGTIINFIIGAIALLFIFGGYIAWNKIGDHFDKTTVGERATIVKTVIDTVAK